MSTKTHNKQASEKEQTQRRVERKSQHQEQMFQPHPTEALQRVANAPRAAVRPADVLALQSSVGNRTVQRLVDRAPLRPMPQALVQRHYEDTVTNVTHQTMAIGSGAGRMDAALKKASAAVGDANSEVMEIVESAEWTQREVMESANESVHGGREGEGEE